LAEMVVEPAVFRFLDAGAVAVVAGTAENAEVPGMCSFACPAGVLPVPVPFAIAVEARRVLTPDEDWSG
jgi:phosphoribosylcarboxyaminoimidazole (NCAIR) mutase